MNNLWKWVLLVFGVVTVPLAVYAQSAGIEPVISSVVVAPSSTGAIVTWSTDEAANSQVAYGTSSVPYSVYSTIDPGLINNHLSSIFGLNPGTTYHFQVLSADASGNMASSTDQVFTTMYAPLSASSTSAVGPIISSVGAVVNPFGASIIWTTDQPSTSQVAYGLSSAPYATSSIENTDLTLSHSVPISDLVPSMTYHFQVMSGDQTGISTSSDSEFVSLPLNPGAGLTTSPLTTSANLPPEVLSVDSSGNILLRGIVLSVDKSTITIGSWGGTWTVTNSGGAEILPSANDFLGIAVGDFVGVTGTVTPGKSWVVDANLVRDWTQTNPLSY